MDKNGKRPNYVDDALHRRVEELARSVGISPAELVREAVEGFAAARTSPRSAEKETALGKRLRAIRARIELSGTPLLGAAEIDRELAEGCRNHDD